MSIYGNLKYDFTFPASNPSGNLILIKSITASSSASVSFVNGSNDVVLDSTYKAYKFVFKNIHPSAQSNIQFNGSTDSGSNYNVTKTTTFFQTRHDEDGTDASLGYETGKDIAQGTGYQQINVVVGTGNDEVTSGELWLFNPSSTTYVKHFFGSSNSYVAAGSYGGHYAGYFNTTSAIDGIDFKMSSGNIDDGTISLYGLA
jgi:hypothetical protein